MRKKAVSGIMLILLFLAMLPLMFYVRPVKASETIYIRADGSIDPPTANIITVDNFTYTLTGNINEPIVIQRNNVVIDGAGYTVQGTGSGTGISLSYRSNVTIKNMKIRTFDEGIYVSYSSNIIISGNNITNNYRGVYLYRSSNNTIYHNNFVDNTYYPQARVWFHDYRNVWDTGYPSGVNYWSNYGGSDLHSGPYQNETGSDGISDSPYVIDALNWDNYPLREPYPFAEPYPWASHDVAITSVATPYSKTILGSGPYSNPAYIGVIVFNQGNNTETFNVTIYANTTGETREINLSSRSGVVIPLDIGDLAYGNYTLSANATIVPGETDTSDNTFVDGWVLLTIAGDVDGDRDVDVGDQRKQQLAMFSIYGDHNWNPYADVDNDGDVDVGDQRKQALHMFLSW